MSTELEQLFEFIRGFDDYPKGLKKVCGESAENIFFPGGMGIFREDGCISGKPVMVLGDQYTSRLNFNKTHGLLQPRTRMTPAFHTLLCFLVEADIDPDLCFFTNAYPGMAVKPVRHGYLRRREEAFFLEHARELFRKELELQKPRLILVLGLRAARFLAPLHPRLEPWMKETTFEGLDENRFSHFTNVPLTPPDTTSLVILVHPVGRHANIHRRRYGKLMGNEAEVRMVKDVGRKT